MDTKAQSALLFSSIIDNPQLLQAIDNAGYEAPTPIQNEMIPHLIAGKDVIGQAQTGTGKTAAFALPLLQNLNLEKSATPQVLVIAPTRELAMQVAESFKEYGTLLKKFNIATLFGGQDYAIQMRQLKKRPQIVIGTPGRLMDQVRRGTLVLDGIKSLVLDEADEMLNMGFLDDVEWVLEKLPKKRQIALFSATMPSSIRKIAQKYLNSPVEVKIKSNTETAATVNQRHMIAQGVGRKTDALLALLEVEDTNGVLVFVRTKIQTVDLAEKLVAKGYLCSALNGDMAQNHRVRAVEQLKNGMINILIATDVAARGLDVKRVSHVINFDIPFDVESYIHRVGRTGRAGSKGEAILFVNPREKRILNNISRVTRKNIPEMRMPSPHDIEKARIEKFTNSVIEMLDNKLSPHQGDYRKLAESICASKEIDPVDLAAALIQKATAPTGLFLYKNSSNKKSDKRTDKPVREKHTDRERSRSKSRAQVTIPAEEGMERYRLEVGYEHNIKPGNIVGAIANEADIDSQHIGRISIYDDHSLIDLPYGMPKEVLRILQRSRVNGFLMKLKKVTDKSDIAGKLDTPKTKSRKQFPKDSVKKKLAKDSKKNKK